MDLDCDDPIVREIPVILNNDEQINLSLICIEEKDSSNLLTDRPQVRFQYEPIDKTLDMFWSRDINHKNFKKELLHKYENEIKQILKSKVDIKLETTAEKILCETRYTGKNLENIYSDFLTGKFQNDKLVLHPIRKYFLMKSSKNYADEFSSKIRNAKTIKSKLNENLSSKTDSDTKSEQNKFEEITIRFSMTGIKAKKAASRKPRIFVPVDLHSFDSNKALATFRKIKSEPQKPSLIPSDLTISKKIPSETSQAKCAILKNT